MIRLTLGLLLIGCGVAGRPRPPGPTPPTAPTQISVNSTPTGFQITVEPPTHDLDGRPLTEPPIILAYIDQPRCDGTPAAQGPASEPLRLPKSAAGKTLRIAGALAGRQGRSAAPIRLSWHQPPPPPEAPLLFVDAQKVVQISWLPPESPVAQIRILRDGVPITDAPAAQAQASDSPGPGTWRYQLQSIGPNVVSGASPDATITLPAD